MKLLNLIKIQLYNYKKSKRFPKIKSCEDIENSIRKWKQKTKTIYDNKVEKVVILLGKSSAFLIVFQMFQQRQSNISC